MFLGQVWLDSLQYLSNKSINDSNCALALCDNRQTIKNLKFPNDFEGSWRGIGWFVGQALCKLESMNH